MSLFRRFQLERAILLYLIGLLFHLTPHLKNANRICICIYNWSTSSMDGAELLSEKLLAV